MAFFATNIPRYSWVPGAVKERNSKNETSNTRILFAKGQKCWFFLFLSISEPLGKIHVGSHIL